MANLISIIAVSSFCVTIWVIYGYVRGHVTRKQLIQQHGCQPLRSTRQHEFLFQLDRFSQLRHWFQKKQPVPDLAEQISQCGYTFRAEVRGRQTIQTVDPTNIRAAWSSPLFGVSVGRKFPMGPLCGAASLTTDGPIWEHSRALMRPIFGRAQYTDLHAFEKHVGNMFRLIPRDKSTVDVQTLLAQMELDSSTEFIFGESVDSLTNNSVDGERFRVSFVEVQRGMAKRFGMPLQLNVLHRDPDFWRGCNGVHHFVDRNIQKAIERRNDPSQKPAPRRIVMVDELLEKTLDLVEIRNQLINAFLPALDTTAVTVSNMIFLLARHPQTYQNLRQEILAEFASDQDTITANMLGPTRLPYLHATINESLRLHPPIAAMSREALADTVLPTGGGPKGDAPVLVRKGESFRANFAQANRRQDIFGTDADEFRPERWEKLQVDKWEFMPFSNGLRSCLGQQLALTEAAYLMVRLVREFEGIENRDEVFEYHPTFRMVTESARGVKVGLLPARN